MARASVRAPGGCARRELAGMTSAARRRTVSMISALSRCRSLQVDAGDPEVGMSELALDHHHRHAFVGHLDCLPRGAADALPSAGARRHWRPRGATLSEPLAATTPRRGPVPAAHRTAPRRAADGAVVATGPIAPSRSCPSRPPGACRPCFCGSGSHRARGRGRSRPARAPRRREARR
jgi:hypothetical protein